MEFHAPKWDELEQARKGPDVNLLVVAARGEAGWIGGVESNAVHAARVAFKCGKTFARICIPEFDGVVVAACCKQCWDGAVPGDAEHQGGVPIERKQARLRLHIPQFGSRVCAG